jgi:hypothetical protein
MRLAQVERGLLINFNVRRLVDGVKRYRIKTSVLSTFSVVKKNGLQ